MQLIADIRGGEGEAAINGVNMAVDQAWEQGLSTQIATFRIFSSSLRGLGQIADADDFVPADSDGLSIRVIRDAGEDFGVKKDAFGLVVALAPQSRRKAEKHKGYEKAYEKAYRTIPSTHSILRCSHLVIFRKRRSTRLSKSTPILS
jgi:hypothetical protein